MTFGSDRFVRALNCTISENAELSRLVPFGFSIAVPNYCTTTFTPLTLSSLSITTT